MRAFAVIFLGVWAVFYAAFWVAGIQAGWAWRRTYALTASRHAAHALLYGVLASFFGGVAVVVAL